MFLNATDRGDFRSVKKLLAQGIDINHRDEKSGYTALLCSCQEGGFYEIAQYLISKGADINLPDNEGATPTFWASQQGHSKIVKLLIG